MLVKLAVVLVGVSCHLVGELLRVRSCLTSLRWFRFLFLCRIYPCTSVVLLADVQ